jgi:GAF domain
MPDHSTWNVVLVRPGEDQLALLADLSARRSVRIVAVFDPEGQSVGASLAPVMGLRVISDLDELEPGEALYLIHPPRDEINSPVVDQALDFGLEPVLAEKFPALLAGELFQARPLPPMASPEVGELEFLEQETAAIHRTLSRIEEALDGESLLRWLLGLATRATGAGSGSILLFDQAAEELYLGFAYGLSQNTMHRTRVKLGEGIAGQVALSRQAQWIGDNRHPGARRDRSSVQSAICSPLTWEGILLGVLNVSTEWGEPELNPNALETIESLTHRFGMILDRFLRLQTVINGEVFRELDEDFSMAQGESAQLGEILNIWLEDISRVCGADGAKLTLLAEDGDLMVADQESLSYPSSLGSGIAEILVSGQPRVQTPESSDEDRDQPGSTVFHLPVGRDPVTAVLTTRFPNSSAAHQFHRISGEILYLLNKHLAGVLERIRLRDQVHRLTALAAVLADVRPGTEAGSPDAEERILAAARQLTGAQQAFLLFAPLDAESATSASAVDETLLQAAEKLLDQASLRGHQASVMSMVKDPDLGVPRSVLAVPLESGSAYPGLVLLDKKRLHPIDGKMFTEFDAMFAKRLATLFETGTGPAAAAPAPRPAPPLKIVEPVPSGDSGPALLPLFNRTVEDLLHREMDRCDRYHNMLGIVGFRCDAFEVPPEQVPTIVQNLCAQLRSSDIAGCLQDGTILVMVPEDIQSLPRLRNRVVEILSTLTENANLRIETATRVYPGGGNTAEALLQSLLAGLK